MPEVHFTIRWPDGSEERCYSPSTAITRHLAANVRYPLPEFLARVRAGLREASDRVEAKYGFACLSALDQLDRIERRAATFDPATFGPATFDPASGDIASGDVTCLALMKETAMFQPRSSVPHTSVVIIGGGQAGLSVSFYLCRDGIDHVVLERHRRFHSWRVNRWDSFCLVTPNWQCRLPGWSYRGTDPDGFMLRDEIVDYLDGFAESFAPPLREEVAVTRVAPRAEGGYLVETADGDWTCDQVVIATGGYDTPIVPPYAGAIDAGIVQMHSREYRRPSQLPEGGTLIVGTGQSGVQLMEDFHREGRPVHLAVGPAPRSPRKYRGRDATDWLYDAGHYAVTIDAHPDPVKAITQTNHYMSGRDGGKEIDLRKFAREGVKLYGSLAGAEGTRLAFLPDLGKNLDDADRSYLGIREQIDGWIARQGIDAPEEPPFEKVWQPEREVTEVDLAAEGITSILWAIGFRPDYSWLEVDCFDGRGKPAFHRGVTDAAGVYFIGLGWLNTWGSGRFLAIDDDARYLAGRIGAYVPAGTGA